MANLPSLNLPQGSPSPPSIDTFADLIGRNEPVHVIDVATQTPAPDKWTVGKWAKYFSSPRSNRKRTLNVISLEFSHTPLARHVRAPQFVLREDWVHTLWPPEETAKWAAINRALPSSKPRGRPPSNPSAREHSVTHDRSGNEKLSYPKASYYFLAGVAGCYTDFHVDFGGSSVWYNIIDGRKEFFCIPPTDENLERFEKWTQSEDQDSTFFGDLVEGPIVKIVVEAGQTLLLPSGWIHAVYTPLDSMVIGGNFLHKYNVDMQIKIAELEQRTNVPFNSRFPFWWLLQFYYLKHCAGNILHNRDLIVRNGHLNLMPDWERRGLIALQSWVGQNMFLCPEGVLDYPIQFYLEVISFRLRGMYPMSFPEWLEFIKIPKKLCVCQFPSEVMLVYNDKTNLVTEEVNPNVVSSAEQEASGASVTWIGCDWCGEWYHGNCVGVPQDHDLPRYFCPNCIPFGPHDLTPAYTQTSPVYVPRAAPPPPPRSANNIPVYAPRPQMVPRPTGPAANTPQAKAAALRPTMRPGPNAAPPAPKPAPPQPTPPPKPQTPAAPTAPPQQEQKRMVFKIERPTMHPPPAQPAPAPTHAAAHPLTPTPPVPPAHAPTPTPAPGATTPARPALPSSAHLTSFDLATLPDSTLSSLVPASPSVRTHIPPKAEPIDSASTLSDPPLAGPRSPPSATQVEEAAKPKAFKFTLKRPREDDTKREALPTTQEVPPAQNEESLEPPTKAPRLDDHDHPHHPPMFGMDFGEEHEMTDHGDPDLGDVHGNGAHDGDFFHEEQSHDPMHTDGDEMFS